MYIDWIEHTGRIGGWPTIVKTYWEGIRDDNKRIFWITSMSTGEWHLQSAGTEGTVSIRDADCDKLKGIAWLMRYT